jgi:hypothetical protein
MDVKVKPAQAMAKKSCLEKNMKNLKTKLKSAHARARLSACRSVCLPKLAQDNPSYPKQVQRVTKKPLKTLKNTYKFKDFVIVKIILILK